jgi:hypothetical protein
MTKRIALFISAMSMGIALATTSIGTASAADECLAKPKGLAPAGKHWYYSTDRKLQRKCWYLDDAGEKIVTPTPRKQPVAAAAAPPANAAEGSQTTSSPNADARAELIEEPRAEQPAAPAVAAPSAPAQLQPAQDSADGTVKRDWTVASRWPNPSDTFASGPASVVLDATPAPRNEAAPPSAPVQDQPAAVGDNGVVIDLGLIAAGAIFLVVIGGMIVLLSRRNAAPQDRMIANAMERDARPWERRDAEPVSMVRPRAPRTRHETIEEIEQLLETRRQVPG